jgi:hypothetical protein
VLRRAVQENLMGLVEIISVQANQELAATVGWDQFGNVCPRCASKRITKAEGRERHYTPNGKAEYGQSLGQVWFCSDCGHCEKQV